MDDVARAQCYLSYSGRGDSVVDPTGSDKLLGGHFCWYHADHPILLSPGAFAIVYLQGRVKDRIRFPLYLSPVLVSCGSSFVCVRVRVFVCYPLCLTEPNVWSNGALKSFFNFLATC